MVQRKAPDKPKAPIEHNKIHGRLDKQFSSPLQQDTRARGGADHKKKLMKVKSIKVSDLDSFESRKTSSIPIRNYMKPTSSSDARKEKLQVTVNSPVGNHKKKSPKSLKKSNVSSGVLSSPRAVKALSRQSSLKAVKSSMKKCSVAALCAKKSVNRATCSSTLKDSKFPSALELNHGATEAEGSSKIRVCPYTYCSLNGHIHEPLPPLKCFISARRKLLKNQRSLKVKGLFSFKTSMLQKEREMIDDELEDEISKNPSDFFVEIYTMPQEEKYHEQWVLDKVEYSDMSFDQKSEFSQDEMDDVMINFLEYVELDHGRTTAQKDYEEDGEIRKSEIKTIDMNWEEEICSFPDNTQMSECPDEQFSVNTTNSCVTSEDEDDDSESEERNSDVFEKEDSDIPEFNSQSIEDDVQIKLSSTTINCQSDDIILGDEAKNPEKELQEASKGTDGNMLNVSAIDYNEIDGSLRSKWNVTKRKANEEFEQVKEFNPRPPNFLPLEPDPEAEKVDLRHQTMDGRRNSEEWMIDYALQRAVTRLGPARKKKVALLVEAFETVVPLPMCEKPVSHGTSTFNHLSYIQACN